VSARGGSWNLFPLLGVNAVIGRTFTESEDRPDGNVVMLTWNLFERRFGGDPSIVGSQIHLDAKPYTVIGVLPEWFTYPDAKVQVWVPYASGLPPAILQHHDFHFSRVVARLRPDESLASTPIFIVLWLGFLLGWLVLVIFGAMPLFRRRPNSKLR